MTFIGVPAASADDAMLSSSSEPQADRPMNSMERGKRYIGFIIFLS